jgi:predicted nucleic acid-binding protein
LPAIRTLTSFRRAGHRFQAGFDLNTARSDKQHSLTDCIAMAAMTREGITGVLTNDRRFQQEGFRVLFRAH